MIFTKRGIDIDKYPAIKEYLTQFKTQLQPKPKDFKGKIWKGRKTGSYKWYEMQDAVDYFEEFEKPKIILPDIALRMQATYDVQRYFTVNTAYIIPVDDKFLIGILNSNLVQFYYQKISSEIRGGYLRFVRQYLEIIPIQKNKDAEIQIIKFVDQILQLHKQKSETKVPALQEQLENQITYTDNKINELVYRLYDLTEEEIKIIEAL